MRPFYKPLNPARHETRVVTLLPGRWDDEIRCTLDVISLDDKPDYSSLSYVWGEPVLFTHIIVEDELFAIRLNLEKALRRIRSETEKKVFWIDSICINQDDMRERAEQVKIMGLIYKSTDQCMIWLGEIEEEPTIKPFEPLEKLPVVECDALERLIRDKNLKTPQPLQSVGRLTASLDIPGAFEVAELIAKDIHFHEMPFYRVLDNGKFEIDTTFSRAVYSLENILKRSWWKRIWTAQESFLSDKAMIHVGHHSISYDTFLKASNSWADHIHSYSHNRWHNCCKPIMHIWMGYQSEDDAEAFFEPIEELHTLQVARDDTDPNKNSVAHNLFLLTVQRRATLRHDHVYGLYGLITEFFDLEEAPDYDIPLPRLFETTTIRFMQNAKHLCLLPLVHLHVREQALKENPPPFLAELPSWCPDWSSVALRDYFDIYNHGGFSADKMQIYDGARQSNAIIKLQGVQVGIVAEVGGLIDDMFVSPTKYVPIVQGWLDLAASLGLGHKAVWEIMHVATHKDVGLGTLDGQDTWWETLQDLKNANATYTQTDDAAKAKHLLHYHQSMKALANRAVFSVETSTKTASGADNTANVTSEYKTALPKGSVGLSLPNTLKGDRIFIVKGGRTPLIFRPLKENDPLVDRTKKGNIPEKELPMCFTLVGVTYIHGMMQGQALANNATYEQVYLL